MIRLAKITFNQYQDPHISEIYINPQDVCWCAPDSRLDEKQAQSIGTPHRELSVLVMATGDRHIVLGSPVFINEMIHEKKRQLLHG